MVDFVSGLAKGSVCAVLYLVELIIG
jgi:hypothetical protein